MREDELSDEFLIDAIASKSMWALERLHGRYSKQLYTLPYRMTADHMLAEELVQDTFLAVWQNASSYSSQKGLVRTWLFSIIYHRTVTHLRSVQRHACLQQNPSLEVEVEKNLAPDVCEQVCSKEQNAELRSCISQLHEEQKEVLELAYFEEYTQSEIAQRCHIPLGTVKARIRLGVHHLRQMLEQQGDTRRPLASTASSSKQTASVVLQLKMRNGL